MEVDERVVSPPQLELSSFAKVISDKIDLMEESDSSSVPLQSFNPYYAAVFKTCLG